MRSGFCTVPLPPLPSKPSQKIVSAAPQADTGGTAVMVTGITHASDEVRPGDLFAALPGSRAHGSTYVPAAAAAGAVAVFTDAAGAPAAAEAGLPAIVVPDARAALGPACERHDAWIIYDAAMERIRFDGKGPSHPAGRDDLAPRTITVGSASKELRLIGWRVGWVTGPAAILADIALVGLTNVVCQVGLAQGAVAAALDAPDPVGLTLIPPQRSWARVSLTRRGEPGVAEAEGHDRLFHVVAVPVAGRDRFVPFRAGDRADDADRPFDACAEAARARKQKPELRPLGRRRFRYGASHREPAWLKSGASNSSSSWTVRIMRAGSARPPFRRATFSIPEGA